MYAKHGIAVVQKYRQVSFFASIKFLKNIAQIEVVQIEHKTPI
jgi:hypothetical protein